MKRNIKEDAVCGECGDPANKVLGMFDYCIAGNMITLCDACTSALLRKTLTGDCLVSSRLKTKADLLIIRNRNVKLNAAQDNVKIPINEVAKKW